MDNNGIGPQLGDLTRQLNTLKKEVGDASTFFSNHTVVKLNDPTPILTDLSTSQTSAIPLEDRKIEVMTEALRFLDNINSQLDRAQGGLDSLKKTLANYQTSVIKPADVQTIIPRGETSGGGPEKRLEERSAASAEVQTHLSRKPPSGTFVVAQRTTSSLASSSTLVTPTTPDVTEREENAGSSVTPKLAPSSPVVTSVTPGELTSTNANRDLSNTPHQQHTSDKGSLQQSPQSEASDELNFNQTEGGTVVRSSMPAGEHQPSAAPTRPPATTGDMVPKEDGGAEGGLQLIGNKVPKFRHVRSRFAKMLEATKRKEGDSRVRHKQKHVKALMRSENDSFVQRDKHLDNLDNLAKPAQEAEAFAQNKDNRPFLHFTSNPGEYFRKNASRTVRVPVGAVGSGSYREKHLPTLIRQKEDQIKKGNDNVVIDDDQLLKLVAEDLANGSEPYKEYLENKVKWDQRESIKNRLVSSKEGFKRDIEKARDAKYSNLLAQNELLDSLKGKHPELLGSLPAEKSKKTLDEVYKTLKLEQKRLKKQKGSLLFRLTGLKMASLNKLFSIRKSAKRKATEDVRSLEKERFSIKQEIAKVEESIDKVQDQRALLEKYNWAADSLIRDLEYSPIRRNKPDNEVENDN